MMVMDARQPAFRGVPIIDEMYGPKKTGRKMMQRMGGVRILFILFIPVNSLYRNYTANVSTSQEIPRSLFFRISRFGEQNRDRIAGFENLTPAVDGLFRLSPLR